MISVKDLTKNFKKRSGDHGNKITAVDHISLKIEMGELFGLIGPNGAGKTTFVKMLSTLILPDEGSAKIDGHDLLKEAPAIRRKIGVLTGEFSRSLYWRLTGKQNLRFFADLYNMPKKRSQERIALLLKQLGLVGWGDELVMKYSTGMKHKLALARALLIDPPILLLDDPTMALDPVSSYEIRRFVEDEFKDKLILWTSHNLHEIEELCDRIALIDHGKVVFEGKPKTLRKSYWEYSLIVVEIAFGNPSVFSDMDEEVTVDGKRIEIKTDDVTRAFRSINEIIAREGITVEGIETRDPTLEEIFMKEVGR